jgi:hypothetical protein
MIASRRCTELNDILTHFPDVAMIRITYEAADCRLTLEFTGAPRKAQNQPRTIQVVKGMPSAHPVK